MAKIIRNQVHAICLSPSRHQRKRTQRLCQTCALWVILARSPEGSLEIPDEEPHINKEIIVANFCAKCGTALSAGEQFCTSCGTAAAPGGAVAAPAQPIPAQRTAPPASSGSSAVKIVLIVVAVVVGLGILSLGAIGFTAWRIARNIHVADNGGKVTFNTPGGTFTANSSETFTASDLGTDIYPGAQSARGGMKMDLPTGSMVTGIYLTSDSKEQVVAFYKSKFGSEAEVMDVTDGALVSLKKSPEESVVVTITANSSQDNGKTRFSIVHTKATKAS